MRRATKQDAVKIVKMTCDIFGDAYMSVREVEDIIADPLDRLYIEDDEKGIAGAILFIREDKDSFMEDMEVDSDDYDRISRGRNVVHHKFSVIREDLRGRGLMTKMLLDAISELEKDDDYGALFTQGWIQPGDIIPMQGIFERAGYIKYKRQISPWYKYYDKASVLCGGRC